MAWDTQRPWEIARIQLLAVDPRPQGVRLLLNRSSSTWPRSRVAKSGPVDLRAWGMDRGLIAANPCARGGRLYRGSRAEKIWTTADESAFLERAPPHLH